MESAFTDAAFIDADVALTDDTDTTVDIQEIDRGGDHVTRKEYGEVALIPLRCPLFILTAPNVHGCKATTSLSSTVGGGWGLTLKLFGNGIEIGKKLTVSWSQEVSATAGRSNRIFLPVWAEAQQVTLHFDDDREVQVRTELTLRLDKMAVNAVGVDTVPPSVFQGHGLKLLEAQLKDYTDTEAVAQTFEYKAEANGSFSLGFRAFGDDQVLEFKADLARSQEVKAELVGGHTYVAVAGGWPLSLVWTVDGKSDH